MPRCPAPLRPAPLAGLACATLAAVAVARAEAPRVPGVGRALAVPASTAAPATRAATPAAATPAAGSAAAASEQASPPKPDAAAPPGATPSVGGFRLTGARVPVAQIVLGGPAKGAIEAIDAPRFATLEQARWVLAESPVLGLARGGEAHVYPVHVIERHQVVNDVIAGAPVVVTYDPLAGSPAVYERSVDGRTLDFGVAGLLYNSNFLLYDRATESLWSQFRGDAVAGELAGARLARIPIRQEPLATFVERHPGALVLEPPSERIDYRYSPFTTYWVENRIPSRVDAVDPRFHAKEVVLGVSRDGKSRAYLGSLVTAAGGRVDDEFAGRKLHIEYSSERAVFRYDAPEDVLVQEAYWFAWKAFHPDTEVWHDPGAIGPLEP
jgi:hypothetical protein